MQQAHLLLDPRDGRGLLLAEERLVAPGADRARRNGVDPDAARPVLDSQRAGQP